MYIDKDDLITQFFKVFGIKPYCVRSCTACYLEQGIDAWEKFNCENTDCDKCEHDKSIWEYPEISDRKLLEMICIILNTEGLLTINTEGNIADIKDFILRFLIGKVNKNPYCHYKTKNKIKHQIQELFKGEEC